MVGIQDRFFLEKIYNESAIFWDWTHLWWPLEIITQDLKNPDGYSSVTSATIAIFLLQKNSVKLQKVKTLGSIMRVQVYFMCVGFWNMP